MPDAKQPAAPPDAEAVRVVGRPTARAHDLNTTTDRAVVVGRSADGSAISDHAYGPYSKARAKTVADRLTAGQWYGMQWSPLPIGALPGAGNSPAES